jgi:hypothetical protein
MTASAAAGGVHYINDENDDAVVVGESYHTNGLPDSGRGTAVYGFSELGTAIQGVSGTGTSVHGVKYAEGHAVLGQVRSSSSTWAATVGLTEGVGPGLYGVNRVGTGDGIWAESRKGRGGRFWGKKAQIRLQPSTATTHPASGLAGDLFLDKAKRLWFCKGGTTWVRLDD